MKKVSSVPFLILVSIAAVLLAASCPLPITDDVVAALEDDFEPVILFTSPDPEDGVTDYFYSSLTVLGTITDDAIFNGDGRGRLSRLSMKVDGESSNYTGGILLDSEGNSEIDTDLGPVIVDYSIGDGTFSFTFDSSDLDEDINVIVTAVDLNDNEQAEILEVRSSSGPQVTIQAPENGDTYSSISEITLTGTICDSVELQSTINEIASVRFMILPEVDETLTLDGSSTAEILEIDNLPPYPAQFQLNNTSFTCTFTPKSSMTSNRTLEVVATDKNGNSRSDSITLYYTAGGPTIDVVAPTLSGNYHSSVTDDDPIYLDFFAEAAASVITDVSYKINGGSEVVLYDAASLDPTELYFPIGGRFNTAYYPYSSKLTIDPDDHSGSNITISFHASDGTEENDPVSRTIYDDSEGPQYFNFRWENASDEAVSYINGSDQVYMRFDLNDALSGEDHDSLAISGTYNDSNFNTALNSQATTEGPYELLFDFTEAGWNNGDNGAVPFTLTALDTIGNVGTYDETHDEDVSPLIYYHSAPSSAPSVSFAKTSTITPSHADYLRDGETIEATINAGRHLDIDQSSFTFIFGGDAKTPVSIVEDSEGVYTASYTVDSNDGDGGLTWEMDYWDMAGNHDDTFSGSSGAFTIDNTPPTVSLQEIDSNSGTHPSVVASGNRSRVYFQFSDSGSGKVESGTYGPAVAFDVGSETIPTLDVVEVWVDSTWKWRGRTNPLDDTAPQGTIIGTITVYDEAGNMGEVEVDDSVTVDTVGPDFDGNPTISSDGASGASGSGSAAGIGDTITVVINLDEATTNTPAVRILAGGQEIDIADRGGTVELSNSDTRITATYDLENTTVSDVPDLVGAVTIEADVQDAYNALVTRSYTSTFTVDNVQPTMSASVSTNGSRTGGTSGSDTKAGIGDTITAIITLSDPQRTGVTPSVEFIADGTIDVNTDGTVSVSTDRYTITATYLVADTAGTDVPDLSGYIDVRAVIRDSHNPAVTRTDTSNSDTVDNVPPAAEITSPADGATILTTANVNVSADVDTDVSSLTFRITDGGTYSDSGTESVSSGSASISFGKPGAGSYTISVDSPVDDHGNAGTGDSISITVSGS